MTKRKRDEQLVIRVAAPLRRELEIAAAEADRELTDFARRLWLDWAEKRFTEREQAA